MMQRLKPGQVVEVTVSSELLPNAGPVPWKRVYRISYCGPRWCTPVAADPETCTLVWANAQGGYGFHFRPYYWSKLEIIDAAEDNP